MSKNVLVVSYFALAFGALLIIGTLAVFAKDTLADVIQYLLTILGLASSAAVTFYMLGKQANDIAEVKVQTNGNLTRKDEEIADLRKQLQLATNRRRR